MALQEIEFHTGVADRFDFACRLLRKAWRKGARVMVTAPGPVLATLDRDLWTREERDFVPHARIGAQTPAALRERTPIWLCESADGAALDGAPDILVNLGAPAPEAVQGFTRIIEIVSREPDDEAAGRQRWRAYKAKGFEVRHHPAAG